MSNDDDILKSIMEQVGSGLPDGFTGRFANVRFAYDAGFRDGDQLTMIADIVTDDPDIGDDGTISDKFFGIGNGWTTEDKGKSIVREDGKKPKLNDGTALGRLVKNLLEQDDFRTAIVARNRDKITYGPLEAGFYEGLTGVFNQHEHTFKINGEEAVQRFYLVDFTEYAGSKPAAKGRGKAAAKPEPVTDDTDDTDDATDTTEAEPAKPARGRGRAKAADTDAAEPAWKAQLADIASRILDTDDGNYDDFLAAAYEEVDGANDDADIQAAIDDDSDNGVFFTVAAAKGITFD